MRFNYIATYLPHSINRRTRSRKRNSSSSDISDISETLRYQISHSSYQRATSRQRRRLDTFIKTVVCSSWLQEYIRTYALLAGYKKSCSCSWRQTNSRVVGPAEIAPSIKSNFLVNYIRKSAFAFLGFTAWVFG
jgi:hypothetical protein